MAGYSGTALPNRYAWPSARWGSIPVEGGVAAAYKQDIAAAADPVAHRLDLEAHYHAISSPLRTAERAHFYKWLAWSASTLQAMLMHFFYPVRLVDDGNATGAAQVKAHAEAQIGAMLDSVDAELASHGKSWLLGDTFSAVDPYLLMLGRWTRSFARPARSLPNVGPYLQRVLARPAVQRAFAIEKLQPPLV